MDFTGFEWLTGKFGYCTNLSYQLFFLKYSGCRKQLHFNFHTSVQTLQIHQDKVSQVRCLLVIPGVFLFCSGAIAPQAVPQPQNWACQSSNPECRKVQRCKITVIFKQKIVIPWTLPTGHHFFHKSSQSDLSSVTLGIYSRVYRAPETWLMFCSILACFVSSQTGFSSRHQKILLYSQRWLLFPSFISFLSLDRRIYWP